MTPRAALAAARRDAVKRLAGALVADERGELVGTVASQTDAASHYANIWTRDNVAPTIHFLRHDPAQVALFLDALIRRQSHDRRTRGLIPIGFSPRFAVIDYGGEEAIGAAHSVDSTLWFLILLGLYVETVGDFTWLAARRDALEAALGLLLAPRFDPLPLLAAPESVTEIDRPAGLYGYPLQLQLLLALALRWSARLLDALGAAPDVPADCRREAEAIEAWVNRWYWLDRALLDARLGLASEGHGAGNPNPFNLDYGRVRAAAAAVAGEGGYLAGTLRTRHVDTRLWTFANCLAAATGFLSPPRARALLHTIDAAWKQMVGGMPLAVCWPHLTGASYKIVMDADTRARPGHYHNGAHWPNILWPFTAAALAHGRADLARRARMIAAERLPAAWGEYYDPAGRLGEGARSSQTWSIAGYLVADEAIRVGLNAFWQIRLRPPGGWEQPLAGAQ